MTKWIMGTIVTAQTPAQLGVIESKVRAMQRPKPWYVPAIVWDSLFARSVAITFTSEFHKPLCDRVHVVPRMGRVRMYRAVTVSQ